LSDTLAAHIRQVKESSTHRNISAASAMAAIGMLAASGIGAKRIVRVLPDLIRRVLPVDTVGFFWSNPSGDMTDAYVENPIFLSADVLLSCQRYQQEDPRNWPSFTENVLAGPVAGYLLPFQTEAFYRSQHFAFTYQRIGARHILDAVMHDGEKPAGCLLFMRSEARGPFTPEEVGLARQIALLLRPAFANTTLPTAEAGSRTFEAGMIAFDGLSPTLHNLAAHQSLWMLAREGGSSMMLEHDDDVEALARRFCQKGVETAHAEGSFIEQQQTAWGAFSTRYETMASGHVLATFQQQLPFVCHLAQWLSGRHTPPRRLIVSWLALLGASRKEIAHLSDLSIHTVAEHINATLASCGASGVPELLRLLAA
jgi:hypothetical protein